jgi:hypothetical protein
MADTATIVPIAACAAAGDTGAIHPWLSAVSNNQTDETPAMTLPIAEIDAARQPPNNAVIAAFDIGPLQTKRRNIERITFFWG